MYGFGCHFSRNRIGFINFTIVDKVIAEQAEAWSKYCGGEQKAMGALVGAIMKASQGKADGKAVTALLLAKKG